MIEKNEILKHQKKQSQLKKEIKNIKKTIPIYLTGFVFTMFLALFLLEEKLYVHFKGSINFILSGIILTIIIGIVFYCIGKQKIKKKEKLSKAIGIKLYGLMKLEND